MAMGDSERESLDSVEDAACSLKQHRGPRMQEQKNRLQLRDRLLSGSQALDPAWVKHRNHLNIAPEKPLGHLHSPLGLAACRNGIRMPTEPRSWRWVLRSCGMSYWREAGRWSPPG